MGSDPRALRRVVRTAAQPQAQARGREPGCPHREDHLPVSAAQTATVTATAPSQTQDSRRIARIILPVGGVEVRDSANETSSLQESLWPSLTN